MPSLPLSALVDQKYSSVYAYAGVEAIRSRLAELGAIVILNEDDTFLGVLTPTDVLIRASRLVIDCLRRKPVIYIDQSVEEAVDTMLTNYETVLPVMHRYGKPVGLLHQHTLIEYLLKENRRLAQENSSIPPLR